MDDQSGLFERQTNIKNRFKKIKINVTTDAEGRHSGTNFSRALFWAWFFELLFPIKGCHNHPNYHCLQLLCARIDRGNTCGESLSFVLSAPK